MVPVEFQAAHEADLHCARALGRREPVVGLEAPDPSAEEVVDVEDEGGGRAHGRVAARVRVAREREGGQVLVALHDVGAAAEQEARGGGFVVNNCVAQRRVAVTVPLLNVGAVVDQEARDGRVLWLRPRLSP